ncbi:MAG: class I mannose-6-phosphate isomerase [Reichenbachiella sp.]
MPFNKEPSVRIKGNHKCLGNWDQIGSELINQVKSNTSAIIAIECYQGVFIDDVINRLSKSISFNHIIRSSSVMKSIEEIEKMTFPDVTDDRVFGYLSRLNIDDFFNQKELQKQKASVLNLSGINLIIGEGASLLCEEPDVIVYADMARWEIQQRMRSNKVQNIGLRNHSEKTELQYKRAFFVDWRVCDRLKKKLRSKIDFWLDTNGAQPKMITNASYEEGLRQALIQPFSLVPFFDPGPWGGQWMRDKFELDPEPENFAWCFNCVPEENSLLLRFGNVTFETPSINLVFFHPKELMGEAVYSRFGDEFPIRFDFLDTMDGGNLSLQVHPLTEYIQEKFGMHYTQDESYYMLDAKPGAKVYLGFKDGVDKKQMFSELRESNHEKPFEADNYVASWEAKKHDHFLIPAGTIHCSGNDGMVLEISATPYIFTFKLWDWGRLGIDGKPRPINVDHGENVLQMDRTTDWVEKELVNNITEVKIGDGWREERTGLHETEFIETRRHWFSKPVTHTTHSTVNVLNLVEGDQAIVESPTGDFEPFVVNYTETFVVPANIVSYTIRPYGSSEGKEIATLKAYVRT